MAAAHGFDRQIIQFRDRLRAGIHVDVVLQRADLGRARRQNQVLRPHGIHHVERRETFCLKRLSIQVDLHLPLLPAVRIRNGRSWNCDQSRADEVNAGIEKLLL